MAKRHDPSPVFVDDVHAVQEALAVGPTGMDDHVDPFRYLDDPSTKVPPVVVDAFGADLPAGDSSGAGDFREWPRGLRAGGLSNRCCAAENEHADADAKTTEI